MIPLKLQAIISNGGKLCFSDTELLRGWLEGNAGRTIEVVFQSPKDMKTQPQLGYLFGHVIPQIAEYTGYAEEEVYGILKGKFLTTILKVKDPATGLLVDTLYVRSLSDCSREEVAKFIQESVDFGLSIGADIYPAQHYGGK